MVYTSYVFGTIVGETRSDSKVERRNEEIYIIVCIGMGVPNLVAE